MPFFSLWFLTNSTSKHQCCTYSFGFLVCSGKFFTLILQATKLQFHFMKTAGKFRNGCLGVTQIIWIKIPIWKKLNILMIFTVLTGQFLVLSCQSILQLPGLVQFMDGALQFRNFSSQVSLALFVQLNSFIQPALQVDVDAFQLFHAFLQFPRKYQMCDYPSGRQGVTPKNGT